MWMTPGGASAAATSTCNVCINVGTFVGDVRWRIHGSAPPPPIILCSDLNLKDLRYRLA